jgi:hypothetical protein
MIRKKRFQKPLTVKPLSGAIVSFARTNYAQIASDAGDVFFDNQLHSGSEFL